jgi:glycogen operon protein
LTLTEWLRTSSIEWHGVRLGAPDWSPESRSLAVTIQGADSRRRFHIILNAHWTRLSFEVPEPGAQGWKRFIDTALPSPEDIREWKEAVPYSGRTYEAESRSVVVLICGS